MLLHKLFILFFTALPGFAFAQNDTIEAYLLDKEPKEQVKTAAENWERTYFDPFLKKNKIRLSCAHCTSVFFEAVFKIQDEGHAHYTITRTKKCGTDFTHKQLKEIEKMLIQLSLPGSLKGKLIRIRFGNALKC